MWCPRCLASRSDRAISDNRQLSISSSFSFCRSAVNRHFCSSSNTVISDSFFFVSLLCLYSLGFIFPKQKLSILINTTVTNRLCFQQKSQGAVKNEAHNFISSQFLGFVKQLLCEVLIVYRLVALFNYRACLSIDIVLILGGAVYKFDFILLNSVIGIKISLFELNL